MANELSRLHRSAIWNLDYIQLDLCCDNDLGNARAADLLSNFKWHSYANDWSFCHFDFGYLASMVLYIIGIDPGSCQHHIIPSLKVFGLTESFWRLLAMVGSKSDNSTTFTDGEVNSKYLENLRIWIFKCFRSPLKADLPSTKSRWINLFIYSRNQKEGVTSQLSNGGTIKSPIWRLFCLFCGIVISHKPF